MIQLRRIRSDDLPLLKGWLHAPHVAPWFRDPLDWIAEVEGRDDDYAWIHHFIVEHGGAPVGFCQYYAVADSGETYAGYDDLTGVYSIDYLIGEAEYLQRGFAKQIVSALIERIAQHDDARRIVVSPEPENAASRGLLNSCGFALNEKTGVFSKELSPAT